MTSGVVEIKINLATLAEQYGLDYLVTASIEQKDDGEMFLTLEGLHDRS